jgi:uncharacterized protein
MRIPISGVFTVLLALPALSRPSDLGAQDSSASTTMSSAIRRSIPILPDSRHVFVLDSAHLLTASEISALQDSAQKLQAATGADIAFVTLPTLHGGAVEEAALAIGRSWKVGSAGAPGDPTRNRVLVVLTVPDKKSVAGPNLRVEVGRGLEGAVTDGGGSRAILEAIKPPFRAKRYGDGFIAGFNVAARTILAENATQPIVKIAPPSSTIQTSSAHPSDLIFFALLGVFIAIAVVIARWRRGPPVLDLTPRDDASASASSFLLNRSRTVEQSSSSTDDNSGSSLDSPSSDTSSSSDGGSFGGGGGFSGGGSSDSV